MSRQCFGVAMKTKFDVTYEDVASHLFDDENSILTFVLDDQSNVNGFAISVALEG